MKLGTLLRDLHGITIDDDELAGRNHNDFTPNEWFNLHHRLNLPGTPGSCMWTWNRYAEAVKYVNQPSHGTQGVGWQRL